MKTKIQPTLIEGVSGFMVGKQFVQMSPHKGSVCMIGDGLTMRFAKRENYEYANSVKFKSDTYELVILDIDEDRIVYDVLVTSGDKILAVLDNYYTT